MSTSQRVSNNTGSIDAMLTSIGTGDVTISTWFKFDDLSADGGIFYAGAFSFDNYYLACKYINSTGKIRLQARSGTTGPDDTIDNDTVIEVGKWYHIVAVRSGTTGKIYVNGALNSTTAANFGVSLGDGSAGVTTGFRDVAGANETGRNKELAIWDAALSDADVYSLYNYGLPNDLALADSYDTDRTANLKLWWRMGDNNNGDLTTVADQTGNGYTGTIVGGAEFVVDHPDGHKNLQVPLQDTAANILARSQDRIGRTALATDTDVFYVFDGSAWRPFEPISYELDASHKISANPSLHLDASILDGSNAANNPSDGSLVTTWGDRSGNGNDFTEATNRPTFKESWLNGKPAIEFNGTDSVLSDSDFFTSVDFSDKNVTMIIVYQPQNDASYSLTDTGSLAGDDRTFSAGGLYSSSFLNTRINNGQYNEKYPANRSAATFGLKIDNSAVSYKIFYNNRLQFDHTSYASSHFQTTGGAMKIGCGDSTYKLDGFISEVLVFNTVLTDDDFDTIHSYIDNKYRVHQYNNVTGSYVLNGTYSTTITPVMHFSAQSNLFKSDGSVPANTEQVFRWTDKARGYHALAGNAPVLNTNQINTSLNGIYFDGVDDYMDIFMLGMLGDFSDFDGTAIFLFEPDTDSAYEPVGIGGSSSGRLYNGGSVTYVDVFRNSRINGAATTGYFANTGAQLASIVSDKTANTYKIFKDGGTNVFNSSQTSDAAAAVFDDAKNMRLGSTTTTPSYHLKGWLYEVFVFDEPLSTANLNAVGNYISSVYGTSYTNIS